MKPSTGKRLTWVELVLRSSTDESKTTIDLAVFTDAELERLEWFAERRLAWSGDDWVKAGLTGEERRELDALLAKTV